MPSIDEQILPRYGIPIATQGRSLAQAFADRLGVQARYGDVDEREELLSEIEHGYADIVAAQLTITEERKERVAFTVPVATVSEVVVGRAGEEGLPRSLEELAGKRVHVRPSSAYAETLMRLNSEKNLGVEIVAVPETMDIESIVFDVSQGNRPLTVVDSHMLATVQTYNPDIAPLVQIADGRQLAWAVRKNNPELLMAANRFLTEHNLTGHTRQLFKGDLQGIKERGVIRLLTRNNPVTYFLHRGEQLGFDYELATMIAKKLGVRLEVVVAPGHDQLIPWLLEGRGDFVGASMTVTPERTVRIAFTRPYLYVSEMLVQRTEGPHRLSSIKELEGKRITVRKSSSYYETLTELQPLVGPFTIETAPEDLETEQLVDKVARGEIDYTVADSHILDVERRYRDDIEGAFVVRPPVQDEAENGAPAGTEDEAENATSAGTEDDAENATPAGTEDEDAEKAGAASSPAAVNGKSAVAETDAARKKIAFAVRPDNAELHAFLDQFVKSVYRGLEYNMAKRRYFGGSSSIRRAREGRASATGALSPYDDLIKKYAKLYRMDWRLMAAQAYQESRFDPSATSWAGAVGLFQVMPSTAEWLGFENPRDPETSIHAGIKYMHQLVNEMDPTIPYRQRVRFALAAYNAGKGHVLDARRLAAQKGWDANRWFGNVEKGMLLLQDPAYYQHARHGYCRGSEPVKYVSEIQLRYDNYVKLFPD